MQNENFARDAQNVNCPSCHARLTAGLRFCRMCGYRLGEGVEEYNETRLFDGQRPPGAGPAEGAPKPAEPFAPPRSAEPFAPPRSAEPFAPPRAAGPFAPHAAWGAAPIQPVAPFSSGLPAAAPRAKMCQSFRMGWVGWMVISLAILFAVGGGVKLLRQGGAARGAAEPPVAVSILEEVDGFDTADGGGAFIQGLDGPDTSLERAGLIGGDIILKFDEQPVRDEAAMRRILAATPPGKTVQVVYVRDGEIRTTTLTTAHEKDYRGMEPIEGRPGGRGQIGVDLGDRVRVPNTNFYGVELDGVNRNQPADLSGLKKNDVVIEFNGKPVRTTGDLRLRIYEAEPGGMVDVVVVRDGQQLKIPVKVGRSRG